MPGAKWLVAHFENPAKQVIQKYRPWDVKMTIFALILAIAITSLQMWNWQIRGLDKTFTQASVQISWCKHNINWREARGSFFTASPVNIHLIVVLSFTNQTFSGVIFCKTPSSIHSYSPISIFMNHLFRWIFKVCDKSFCTWHWSKESGVRQNLWSVTIFSEDLAKTSSHHFNLKYWKSTYWS